MERDLGALQWVADELGQVSDELVRALLGYADNLSDATRLRACLTFAHQIHATLRLLAVPSAVELAAEIEGILQALLNGDLTPSDEALQALLAATMELPAYLRRVGVERRESLRDILGTLNELRALRGAAPLPPPPVELSFARAAFASETGEQAPPATPEVVQLLRLVRQRFQGELLGVLRHDELAQRLNQLVRIFSLFGERLASSGHRLFWETVAAWMEALERGGLELDEQMLALMRDIDGELRAGVALEEGCYRRVPEPAVCAGLLEALSRSAPVSERVVEAQRRHRLLATPVTRSDLGATGAAIVALADELGAVLQRLEAADGDAPAVVRTLQEVEPDLRRATQLLGGLGFQDEHRILQEQLDRIAAGFVPGAGLEDQLTAISAALLDVDQRLAARAVAAGDGGASAETRRHPLQRALETVCRETGDVLGRVKQSVADYLSSHGGVGEFAAIPQELYRLGSVLKMAGFEAAANVLQGCRDHFAAILAGERPTPASRVIDTLADALGAVEYFLERFVIDGHASQLILTRVSGELHRLADATPEDTAAGAPMHTGTESILELLAVEAQPVSPIVEPESATGVSAPEPKPTAAAPEPPVPVDVAAATESAVEAPDPEIIEIFVEEATEVLETIDSQLPQWKAVRQPGRALTELRRAFHTLKGSGRMVGAMVIGELAWSVENLLNRIIDGTREATDAIVAAVDSARELLPPLLAAFAEGTVADGAGVNALRTRLDALARGVEPLPEKPVPIEERGTEAGEGERLHTIFAEELADHLRALRTYLDGAEHGVVTQTLLRTLHTLRGSSRAAGNDALVRVLEPLDDMIHAACDEDARRLSPERVALLSALCELLARTVGQPDDVAGLRAQAESLREHIEQVLPRTADAVRPVARATGFLQEALEQVLRAGKLLEAWRAAPASAADGQALFAELHAVDEGAMALGIDGVLHLSRPLLAALAPVMQHGIPTSAELLDAVADGVEACLDALDRLAAGELPESPATVIERLEACARSVVEQPSDASPVLVDAPEVVRERIRGDLLETEPELLGIFVEEAEELMTGIEEAIDLWRRDRGNRLPFDDLQRFLHTLKGGARMAGLRYLGELAHDFETLLIGEATQFGHADDAFLARVTGFHAQLLRAMDVVRERPAPPVPPMPDEVEVPAVEAPVIALLPVSEEAAATESQPEITVIALPPQAPVATPATAVKPRDEAVRVSAHLLEELVNLAGEASISRARVEEQVSELGQLFGDMQSAIERVQSQVRRLDIATEAQVLFRRERAEGASAEGFDPLEMDRYSQLQQLSRSLVESASDLLDIKRTLAEKTGDLETVLIQQARINGQLQEGLMRSRMVPFASVGPRLKRVVRQVAAELGKDVELDVSNIGGELDRGILERVVVPLEHMLRNAVDHGIEPLALRHERGKPATGGIRIDVVRDGGDVLITVEDDGRGVDLAAVRSKAIERGLLDPEAMLRDHDVLQFILHPGFSTAAAVTQISGRGVGMDVVSSEIRQMGGSLEIDSRAGRGTRFVVRLPFTVSVNRALLVAVGQETYALPLNTVAGVVRLRVDELAQYAADQRLFEYAGQDYRVRYLGAVLHPDEQRDLSVDGETVPLVLVRGGGQALAVEVDRLLGARDIAVKSLGPQFGAVPGLSGATVLGNGSVVLILDLPAMLRADAARGLTAYERGVWVSPQRDAQRPPLVMVVDDSVTVRKVTTRFLEREGMQVLTAKDGAEAMLKLQEQIPDVMLLDIEMPHMDGFEVIAKVRLNQALRHLPVVMITSRTGDKHRERAFALGANAYLGKPYQESVLLAQIHALLDHAEAMA